MKVLSLSTVPLLPFLGSGKTRLMWTQGLRDLGHDVTVLQPSDFEFLESFKKATQLRFAIGILMAVRKKLKYNKYDLIEFYGAQYWLLLVWLRFTKYKPLMVAHVDGIELHDMDKEQLYYNTRTGLKKWLFEGTHRKAAEITFNLSKKYVCGCKDDLDYVVDRGIFSIDSAVCISPGIDQLYHELEFRNEKKKVISFLGSWTERKGVNIIPFVLTNILKTYPDYEFHIYGAWHSKEHILSLFPDELRQRIIVSERLSLPELNVKLLECGVFFFPSYSEGFGLATVESMSCSCAVVTTKTGVGSNLIHGEDALIVDFDDKENMIKSIKILLDDEKLRTNISYQGYLRAKEFRWEKQIKKLETVYINWLNEF